LTFVLHFHYLQRIYRSWTIGQIDRHIFSAEDYTNMSYYNNCGIRPSTVTFQKRWGRGLLQFVWY